MAHRASGYLMRSMMQQKTRSFSTASSPTPKSKWIRADFAPIYIVAGFVIIAGGIASHTGYQQLVHNPNVYFNKKKREMINELENPMQAVNHGGRYVDNSFLRKVAHVQDKGKETVPNPVNGNIYTRSRHAETLESIKS
ncbi:uncharacterized protein LOC110735997 [Chenopodium quinoa]|uniref:uncharacterized protein LOC110735997 n=1 Tax=Chenopodium quinoa TaxID=63459 RepID=UPI000B780D3A|nr:uncharacterized protein LOC110735997 [Chenopodium quinoa]